MCQLCRIMEYSVAEGVAWYGSEIWCIFRPDFLARFLVRFFGVQYKSLMHFLGGWGVGDRSVIIEDNIVTTFSSIP